MIPDEITLSFDETCEWTRRSPRTVRRWIADGRLVPQEQDYLGQDRYGLAEVLRVERQMWRNRRAGVAAERASA